MLKYIIFLGVLITFVRALSPCTSGMFGLLSNINPDYIIVGGGAGGSVTTSKCISKGYRCTLIERGIDYSEQPLVSIPSAVGLVLQTNAVTTSTSQPLIDMFNKTLNFPEPNIIGGSTSINGMISVFTDIENYYQELGIPGITYQTMLPYYLEVTNSFNRPAYSGPVDVTNTPTDDLQYLVFKNAIKSVFPNIPEKLPDMNTASINASFPGFGPPETTVKTTYAQIGSIKIPLAGIRESAYTAYIQPIRSNSNLRLMLRSRVDKVIFDSTGTIAQSVYVTYTDILGIQHQCMLTANNGIILSAGALRTPQILLQSGIGPADDLAALGIQLIKNMSNVGKHLDDQPTVIRQFIGLLPDSPISANINGNAYWNYQDNSSIIPNWSIQISGLVGLQIKSVLHVLMDTQSRGSVRLRSNDPAEQPIYDFNYFNVEDDLITTALGFVKTNEITTNLNYIQIPYTGTAGSEIICPSYLPDCKNDMVKYYQAAFIQYGSVGYHYTGTCALGKVVDPDTAKIYGFQNLYIIDASVFPKTPRGNTQISTYAMSTRLAEFIF